MFNNIMYMSTWNHITQTMNFSTFKERDTMVDMVAIGDVVKKKEIKFLHFVALFLAFEARPPSH